jgi:RNA polymerase sigma factor (sigma-70 family)
VVRERPHRPHARRERLARAAKPERALELGLRIGHLHGLTAFAALDLRGSRADARAVRRLAYTRRMTAEHEARVAAARSGDAAALEELLREHRAEIVRYAMRLCISPEDAQDATQEALLALSRYIGALRELAALSSWLFTAVRTHCTRLARRSLRYALQGEGDGVSLEGPTPEEQLVDRQLRHRLSLVVSGLDPLLRDALLRRDVLGESAAEAAAALGISVEALKSRLHRARGEAKRRLLADLRAPSPPARRARAIS